MKYAVYIITDANRSSLHTGVSGDIVKTLDFYRKNNENYFDATGQFARLIYFEEFRNQQDALNRLQSITQYTRLQKDRLIRSCNPNWVDLSLGLETDNIIRMRLPYDANMHNVRLMLS